uniref:Uncharacterized protein LOC100367119 n=1 Tax=Saccoglossus kowalevskii TaxID=10224 RepID=A0ABM0GQG0_SACKO|nr:PREDICTED: uncharacterized protein LOC100367119 [Saccoglossus kowalevskii]
MARILLLTLFCLVCLSTGIVGESDDGGLFDDSLFENLSDKPLLKAMMLKNLFGGSIGGDSGPPPMLKALLLKKVLGDEGVPAPLERALSANAPSPIIRALIAKQVMQNEDAMLPKIMLFKTLATNLGKKLVNECMKMIDDRKVYTFAIPMICDCALEYTTDEGVMAGFHVDLLKEVCKEAGKKCVGVYDPSEKCMGHSGRYFTVGHGLAGKEYDACFGWFNTVERQQVVSFTESYWEVENKYYLYVKSGNPNGFDATNITSKTIGFVTAWSGGHPCLSGITGADSMTYDYAENLDALIDNLENDKVDAIFVQNEYSNPAIEKGYERIGESIECAESGISHGVTRKDNPLPWFSETLKEMKENGKYYGVCAKAKQDHGHKGDINCV